MGRSFLSSEVSPNRAIIRAATAIALSASGRDTPTEVLRRAWPRDQAALRLVERAAVGEATTSTWGEPVVGAATAAFVTSLAPRSAAARLIQAGIRVDNPGVTSIP